jgi:hypothetical protein
MSAEVYWKNKYDNLRLSLINLAEGEHTKIDDAPIPDEPISSSDVLYISNDWQVTDNEKFAKDVFGWGKYMVFKKTT